MQSMPVPCIPCMERDKTMDHIVVVERRDPRTGKPRKIGVIECTDKREAEHVATLITDMGTMFGTPCIKVWQPGGGSVTLDYIAIERLLDTYTSNAPSRGKPSMAAG